MRIRILDRVLVAVAGVLLLAVSAAVVAQIFFSVDVIGFLTELLAKDSEKVKIFAAAGAAVLLLLGGYCVLLLFRHRRRKDKFIIQKMESGDLAISLKAMDGMIQKCLDQHKELETQSVHLENQRDGLLIRIRGTVAGGISIPLTIDTLQKQIKQYVTACSGVEVKSIRIQIEGSGEDAKDAPFAIDAPAGIQLLRDGERKTAEEDIKAEIEMPVPEPEKNSENSEETGTPSPADSEKAAATAAMNAAEALMDEYPEDDDRPLHQRLFSTPEEPCIMPLPPENLQNPEGEEQETAGKETVSDEARDGENTISGEAADDEETISAEVFSEDTEKPETDETENAEGAYEG